MESLLHSDGREALIELRVFSEANGRSLTDVRAVVDTGFTGFLTLPRVTIQCLRRMPPVVAEYAQRCLY